MGITESEAVLLDAITLDTSAFVATHLLGGAAHAFGWAEASYANFRLETAEILGQRAEDIHLIGSGKTGFSQNASHLLRPFAGDSDLDIVVVSQDVFDRGSLELLTKAGKILLGSADERRRLKRSRSDVFNGYLRPDHLPLRTDLVRDWFPRLAGPYKHAIARSHPVKAWVFKTLDHALHCYSSHHDSIRADLARLAALRGQNIADSR